MLWRVLGKASWSDGGILATSWGYSGATALGKPWKIYADSIGLSKQSWEIPWGDLQNLRGVLTTSWTGILRRLPWGLLGAVLQNPQGIVPNSWAHSSPTALGSLWEIQVKCSGDSGPILDTFFGDCPGECLGKTRKVPKGAWANLGDILGRLPWGVLGEVIQCACGILAEF